MFFFFHLVTGIILGLLIADLLHDHRWIIPCVIGAALPDIIDKPLNFILLPAINGNGRFLFHNLILFAIILVAGFLIWKYYASPVIVALDVGILSHQILDSMWMEPQNWLYPLLGPYPVLPVSPPDHLFDLLQADLSNPVEWGFIIVCTCALVLYSQRVFITTAAARHKKNAGTLLQCAVFMLWAFCGIMLGCALLKIPLKGLAGGAGEDLFTSAVIALAIILLIRWKTALKNTPPLTEDPETCNNPAPPH
jgi:inner membrane protein